MSLDLQGPFIIVSSMKWTCCTWLLSFHCIFILDAVFFVNLSYVGSAYVFVGEIDFAYFYYKILENVHRVPFNMQESCYNNFINEMHLLCLAFERSLWLWLIIVLVNSHMYLASCLYEPNFKLVWSLCVAWY